MAELVDAMVSNTIVFTDMPVRVRLGVQKQSENESESEHSTSVFSSFSFCFSLNCRMFEFQNLEVYKKAKAFHLDCKGLILNYKLDNYVKDQLARASFSIILNIAEGSGNFSKPDRRNYFTTARASVFECVAILDMLHDTEVINKDQFENHLEKADELSRILYAMVKNLS